MKKYSVYLLAISFLTVLSACKKESGDELVGEGPVTIELDHMAGTQSFQFGNTYTNSAGENLTFSKMQYYVSNFVFVKKDGSEYAVSKDDCYFLVKHEDINSRRLTFNNVPAGEYTGVKFIVGVDSLKSVSDISERTGVLDPAGDGADMYWTWNSGYIFFKIEGTSPSAPMNSTTNTNLFMYHIGGFGGLSSATPNNIKSFSLTAPEEAIKVSKDRAPEVHLTVDVMEAFKSPSDFSVAAVPVVHGGANGEIMAGNYADMIKFDHVHND